MSKVKDDVNPSNYPSLSFEDAKKKVKSSIENISDTSGIDSDKFFAKIFDK